MNDAIQFSFFFSIKMSQIKSVACVLLLGPAIGKASAFTDRGLLNPTSEQFDTRFVTAPGEKA